jgi:hypothetical protein
MGWALVATMRYLAFLDCLRREISTDKNFQDLNRPLPLSEITLLKITFPPAALLDRQWKGGGARNEAHTTEDIVTPGRSEGVCHLASRLPLTLKFLWVQPMGC